MNSGVKPEWEGTKSSLVGEGLWLNFLSGTCIGGPLLKPVRICWCARRILLRGGPKIRWCGSSILCGGGHKSHPRQ